MEWDKSHLKKITPLVQSLLSFDEVVIQNQLHPNISFTEHFKESDKLKKALFTIPEPKLSYTFS
jgi:hypothetical protein